MAEEKKQRIIHGGRYRLEKLLGEGGVGRVYQAYDTLKQATVAIKLLQPLSGGQQDASLLIREFAILSGLSHPHLAGLLDCGFLTPDNQFFLCYPFIRGRRIDAVVSGGDGAAIVPLAQQLCQALEYIHLHGVLHLDLKPSNVLVEEEGGGQKAVLLDFGSAVECDAPEREISGTIAYLAPERIRGEAVDPRADLYSLGVLLYRLATGQPPFAGRDQAETLRQHLEQEPPPPRSINPALSAELETVILKLLQKKPALRYASARQVQRALARCPGGAPAALSEEATDLAQSPRFCGRSREIAALQGWERQLEERPGAVPLLALSGAAGSGKSRLLQEWRKQLLLKKRRDFFHLDLASPASGGLSQLWSWLEEMEPPAAGNPPPSADVAADTLLRLEQWARRLERLAQRRPLLLVCDSLEAAPKADLNILFYLLRRLLAGGGVGLGLVLCGRGEEALPTSLLPLKPLLADTPRLLSLHLQPLAAEEAQELVQSIFGAAPLPEKALRWLLQRGQGNPLFLQETVRYLLHHGDLIIDPQTEAVECRQLPPPSALPQSLTDLAEQSLAALAGRDSGELFSWLALSHQGLSENDLSELLDWPLLKLGEALQRLAQGGMIIAEGASFRPPQALWRELCRKQMSAAEWQLRQRRLGEFWRRRWQAGLAPAAAAFEHLDAAGDTAAAVEPGLATLRQWQAAGNTAAARELMQRLLQYPPPALIAAAAPLQDLYLQWADLCIAQGDWPMAALALARGERQGVEKAALTARRARLLQKQGKPEEAFALLRAGSEELRGESLPIAASALLGLGRFAEALALTERGLRDAPGEPQLLNLQGEAFFHLEQYRESRQAYQEALAQSQARRESKGLLYARSGLAALAQANGDLGQARSLLQQLIRQADQDGDVVPLGQASLQLGTLCHQQADYREALQAYRRALEIGQRTGHAALELRAHLNLGNLKFFLGAFAEAERSAETALSLARSSGDRQYEGFALILRALCLEKHGDPAGAAAGLAQGQEVFAEIAFAPGQLQVALERLRLAPGDAAGQDPAFAELVRQAEAAGNREMILAVFSAWALLRAERLPAEGKTLSLLLQAKGLAEECREKRELAKLGLALYRVHLARGHRQLAVDAAQQALEWIETLHAVLPEEYQEGFLRSLHYAELQEAAGPSAVRPSRRPPLPEAGNREDEPTLLGAASVPPPAVLDKLLGILSRFQRSTHLEALLEEILEAAIEITGAQRGLLLTGGPGDTTVRLSRGPQGTDLASPQFQYSRTAVEQVWRSGAALLTVDAESDAATREAQSVARLSLKSILCAPLFILDRVEGVIYLDHRRKKGVFDEQARHWLEILTSQASFALERAKMVQQLIDKNSQIERLLEELEQRVTVQKAELERVRSELNNRDQQLRLRYRYSNIIGHSDKMQQLFRLLDRITDKEIPVLICGESGTGKELVARALHYNGPRQDGPFVAESCANLPPSLFESEFFGHVQGAFTGAHRDKVGLFEAAHGGTLFLDEIGEMPLAVQPKLLRALQERSIRRVGGTAPLPVDVRVIAASNRNLKELAAKGLFRQDLLYRLNVVSVELPPLRQRREDIPLLVAHFLRAIAEREKRPPKKISDPALALLARYDWPGNVRELEHELESLWLLAGEMIEPADLPERIRGRPRRQAAKRMSGTIKEMVDRLEREILLETLEKVKGNKSQAARELGLSRLGLRKKMVRLGLLSAAADEVEEET